MKQSQRILQDVNSEKYRTERDFRLWNLLRSILLLAGPMEVLNCFAPAAGRWTLLAFSLLPTMALVLTVTGSTASRVASWLCIGAGVLTVAAGPESVRQGMLYFCNQLITLWNTRFDEYFPLFNAAADDTARMRFLILLTLVIVVAVTVSVSGERKVLLAVYGFGQIFMGNFLGLAIPPLSCAAFTLGWLGLFAEKGPPRQGRVRKLFLLALTGCMALVLVLGTARYRADADVAVLRGKILDGVNEMRYGSDTLPQGDMTRATTLVGSADTPTLKLSMDHPAELYLKGFVGAVFDGTSWSTLSRANYAGDNAGILEWLAEQQFETPYQVARYMMLVQPDTPVQTLRVENNGANRRYLYLPYTAAALVEGTGRTAYDWQVEAPGLFGAGRYALLVCDQQLPTERLTRQTMDNGTQESRRYQEAENVYRGFVYETYLSLSEKERAEAEQLFFNGDATAWQSQSLYQITTHIRMMLQQYCAYNAAPPAFRAGDDFLRWLTGDAKKANAAYYSTAAVLAFRAAGVPARYVEGYHLSATDSTAMEIEGVTETQLSAANAHAWAEIYMEEVGWMPIETVPGHYYAEYTTQQVLSAPETSITLVEDGAETKGTTADTLEPKDEPEKPAAGEAARRVFYTLGLLLFALALLVGLRLLLDLQSSLRCAYRRRTMKTIDAAACGESYRRVCCALRASGVADDYDFPYKNANAVADAFPALKKWEYLRYIQLVQKSVFGGMTLTPAEQRAVLTFEIRLIEEAAHHAQLLGRMQMHWQFALY